MNIIKSTPEQACKKKVELDFDFFYHDLNGINIHELACNIFNHISKNNHAYISINGSCLILDNKCNCNINLANIIWYLKIKQIKSPILIVDDNQEILYAANHNECIEQFTCDIYNTISQKWFCHVDIYWNTFYFDNQDDISLGDILWYIILSKLENNKYLKTSTKSELTDTLTQ